MTSEELREIRERVEAATPGPWRGLFYDTEAQIITGIRVGPRRPIPDEEPPTQADFVFISHARQDVPQLLDEIAARGETLEDLGFQLRTYREHVRRANEILVKVADGTITERDMKAADELLGRR